VEKRLSAKDTLNRTDLLTRLIESKDPTTGQGLNTIELQTEAFGFVVAGSHTTATTMTFLLYHLLTNPSVKDKLVKELVASDPGTKLSNLDDIGESPYFQACIKETLRINPAFSMPLPRVVPPGGREIAEEFIPAGVLIFRGFTNSR
jgi:cytochrome P450